MKADVTFTVGKADLPRAKLVMRRSPARCAPLSIRYEEDIVKVSIVGLGMRTHAGVAARMFQLLAGGWDQHPGDLHERDQDLVPGLDEVCRARRPRVARWLRARRQSLTGPVLPS